MANDFSGDANCVALWKLDDGVLTVDDKGTNTLTNNNAVTSDNADFKEGDGSADFENSGAENQHLSITDTNLDAGFPLKNGDANKKISVCTWYKQESEVSLGGLFAKWDSVGGKRSFALVTDNEIGGNYARLLLGYNGGASTEFSTIFGTNFVSGIWYHIGATFQDSDKSYRIRVWDDNAGALLDADVIGNFTNNIDINNAAVTLGALNPPSNLFDGKLDETVIFKDILTLGEIDQIRAGTYSVAAGHNVAIIEHHLRMMRNQ